MADRTAGRWEGFAAEFPAAIDQGYRYTRVFLAVLLPLIFSSLGTRNWQLAHTPKNWWGPRSDCDLLSWRGAISRLGWSDDLHCKNMSRQRMSRWPLYSFCVRWRHTDLSFSIQVASRWHYRQQSWSGRFRRSHIDLRSQGRVFGHLKRRKRAMKSYFWRGGCLSICYFRCPCLF